MESKIKGRDFILLGIQPWDLDIGHNFRNIAPVIAQNNRVLYVNRPLDRITKWKAPNDIKTINRLKSIKKGDGVLSEVKKNLWIFNPQTTLESINWMPHNGLYKYYNKRNNRKLADQIKKACEQLQFVNPILFIDNDFFNGLYLQDYLQVDCTIYYLRDYLLAQPYFVKHGKYSEPELMTKADVVVTNSLYLTAYAEKYNQKSYYTGQGCSDDYFVIPTTVPDDMRRIQKPIIGYCGYLTTGRLDIQLLENICSTRRNWNFVFIGPEDEGFKISSLHQMNNVIFLGNKPESELPAYVYNFDVCLNPQIVNQLTIGNYPRKIDEYLACGKPVVATRTETMEAFADCTYLCSSADEYINAIEDALKDAGDLQKKEYRIAVAKSHSWERTVNNVFDAVLQFKK